jgi:hypothetical protein
LAFTGRLEEINQGLTTLIKANVIFVIKRKQKDGYIFRIKVLSPNGKTMESVNLDRELKFNIDVIDNKVKWLD